MKATPLPRGHEVLRGYQIAGYSRSDDATGWRLFRLDGVVDLRVIEQSCRGRVVVTTLMTRTWKRSIAISSPAR